MSYTVHYKEQGTGKPVLPDKTVEEKEYGELVYEYAVDVPGYRMLEPTTQSIKISTGSNEITFWYTRRNDLSYIVNYKEKGTNASLKLPKVVNDVTFGTVIQSAREIVDITGYKYDSVDKDSLTVGADTNENEITIFYTKRNDLSYIVRFLELNTYERLRTPKTVEGVEYDTVIRTENEVEPIEGYVFHSSDIDQIRIGTGDNIINLFYKKGKYNYTVYYKETGTNRKLHEPKEVVGKEFGTTIYAENEVEDIEGYNYDYADKYNMIIGTDESENTITIYYTKITGLQLKVNYLDKDTNEPVAPSHKEGGFEYGDTANASDYIATIDGYTFYGVDRDWVTIDNDNNNNVINIYYTKNEYTYKVNYIDIETDQEIKPEKEQGGVKFGDTVNSSTEIITIDGYTFDHVDKGSIRITSGENRIKIYYRRRNDLSYKVRYLEKDTNIVLNPETTKTGKKFGDVVSASSEVIGINGYAYDSADADTITIGTGENVITLYYVRRNDLGYKVYYKEEGTNRQLRTPTTREGFKFGQTVDSSTEIVEIEGYTFVRADKDILRIEVEGNEITLFYKQKNDLSYTVNYLEKDTNRVLSRAKVVSNVSYGNTITSNSEVIEIPGYVYDSVDKDYLIIGESGNEITIYYRKDNFGYRVNFKDKETGATIRTSKVVNNIPYGSIIESSDEVEEIAGYTYDSADEDNITIGTGRNVITLYYVKARDCSYTVYYKETGTNQKLHEPKTVVGQKYQTEIRAENEVIDIPGYNYDYPDRYNLILDHNSNNNTITIFYTKVNGISFKINYKDKETDEPIAPSHREGNNTYGDIVYAEDYIVPIDGYTYDSQDKDSITIVEDETKNEINIYYTKRDDLSYKVNYLEKDTNEILKPQKTVENATFGDIITARSQIEDITGYNYYNSDKDSIKIGTGNNEITLYYVKKNDLSYTVNYVEQETNRILKTPKTGYNKQIGDQVTATSEIVEIPGYNYSFCR